MINYTAKEVIELKGFISTRFKGYSMYPFLRTQKDTVFILKKTERLKKYDVALFVRENDESNYVLHRICKVRKGSYDIVGDNNLRADKFIKENAVIGVLAGYYRGEKYISCNSFKFKFLSRVWYFFPIKLFGVYLFRFKCRLKRKAHNKK